MTLDDYCEENHIEKIDFLKMDVEGNELNKFKLPNTHVATEKDKSRSEYKILKIFQMKWSMSGKNLNLNILSSMKKTAMQVDAS